jgi:CRP-like cAMP-binding protein
MSRTRTASKDPESEAIGTLLANRLSEHSPLSARDRQFIHALRPRSLAVASGTDLVRQGDKPKESVFLLSGMIGRYHTVANGARQYLSLHIRGDCPDLQSVLLGEMDHGLAAIDDVEIAMLPHQQLKSIFAKSQAVMIACWRQTLLDAATFRQAITTNGTRQGVARVAHLFCEQYVRAQQAGIAIDNTCSFPLTQTQIGQALGLSVVTVNRAIQHLRRLRSIELRAGRLTVLDWDELEECAQFDRSYLHLDLASASVSPPRHHGRR